VGRATPPAPRPTPRANPAVSPDVVLLARARESRT
jgi:hypothetical protein